MRVKRTKWLYYNELCVIDQVLSSRQSFRSNPSLQRGQRMAGRLTVPTPNTPGESQDFLSLLKARRNKQQPTSIMEEVKAAAGLTNQNQTATEPLLSSPNSQVQEFIG
jgi:hypothetical protein